MPRCAVDSKTNSEAGRDYCDVEAKAAPEAENVMAIYDKPFYEYKAEK
jgi:hypothetical protein